MFVVFYAISKKTTNMMVKDKTVDYIVIMFNEKWFLVELLKSLL